MHLNEQEIAEASEAILNKKFYKLKGRVRRHLQECDQCADEVVVVSTFIEDSVERTTITNKIRLNRFRVAISIAASIIISVFAWRIFTDNKIVDQDKNQAGVATKERALDGNLDREYYNQLLVAGKCNKLEMLVERFEDGALRGGEITVTSPTTIISDADQFSISWNSREEQQVTILLYNNRGEKLSEELSSGDSYSSTELIESGLYYWKMLDCDGELIFCGRVIIK